MLEVIVNGVKEKTDATNLAEFISIRVKSNDQFAVALNESFVAKSQYAEHQLQDGDRIELVAPMSGG